MKVLTDFDGTLTNIEHEFNFECHYILRVLEERFGMPPEETQKLLQSANAELQRSPRSYGWTCGPKITAFCDEDLFMMMSSAMTLLDTWKSNPPEEIASILNKYEGVVFYDIVEDAHQAMNLEPLCPGNVPDAETIQALQTLLDRDCEIVVASNSPAQRIIDKFEYAGLLPVDHDNNPSAHFRVRGNVGKYKLGNTPNRLDFGGRLVDVDRPFFEAVIREERPQVIIGDVFSLDLALPIDMLRRDPLVYEDLQLYLRTRSYTPQWALSECTRMSQQELAGTMRIIGNYRDLPDSILRH